MVRRLVFLAALIALGAAPKTISRDDWVKALRTALPAAFCKPEQYFRQCFKVTQAECEQTALSTTRVCLEDLKDKIPETLKQPDDGGLWGAKVGECAGNAYEVSLTKKKIQSDKCNDPNAWR